MSTVYSEDSKWGQTFPSVYSDAQEDPWQTVESAKTNVLTDSIFVRIAAMVDASSFWVSQVPFGCDDITGTPLGKVLYKFYAPKSVAQVTLVPWENLPKLGDF